MTSTVPSDAGKGRSVTLDGFLTVLALPAAIYAVLSPVQRLRASLSWRAQMVVAIPACIAILAYELFDARPPACPSLVGGWCRLTHFDSYDQYELGDYGTALKARRVAQGALE